MSKEDIQKDLERLEKDLGMEMKGQSSLEKLIMSMRKKGPIKGTKKFIKERTKESLKTKGRGATVQTVSRLIFNKQGADVMSALFDKKSKRYPRAGKPKPGAPGAGADLSGIYKKLDGISTDITESFVHMDDAFKGVKGDLTEAFSHMDDAFKDVKNDITETYSETDDSLRSIIQSIEGLSSTVNDISAGVDEVTKNIIDALDRSGGDNQDIVKKVSDRIGKLAGILKNIVNEIRDKNGKLTSNIVEKIKELIQEEIDIRFDEQDEVLDKIVKAVEKCAGSSADPKKDDFFSAKDKEEQLQESLEDALTEVAEEHPEIFKGGEEEEGGIVDSIIGGLGTAAKVAGGIALAPELATAGLAAAGVAAVGGLGYAAYKGLSGGDEEKAPRPTPTTPTAAPTPAAAPAPVVASAAPTPAPAPAVASTTPAAAPAAAPAPVVASAAPAAAAPDQTRYGNTMSDSSGKQLVWDKQQKAWVSPSATDPEYQKIYDQIISEVPEEMRNDPGVIKTAREEAEIQLKYKKAGVPYQRGDRDLIEKREAGGPVQGDTPYLVGEKGPEVIVPDSSGIVIPNDQITGEPTADNLKAVAMSAYGEQGVNIVSVDSNGNVDVEDTFANMLDEANKPGGLYDTIASLPRIMLAKMEEMQADPSFNELSAEDKSEFLKAKKELEAELPAMDVQLASMKEESAAGVKTFRDRRALEKAASSADLQPRAAGGPVQSGTPYLMGERGPELLVPNINTGQQLIDANRQFDSGKSQLHQMMNSSRNSSRSPTIVNNNSNVSMPAGGDDKIKVSNDENSFNRSTRGDSDHPLAAFNF